MYYSLIGILAILVLFITNYDVFFVKQTAETSSVQRVYRRWLFAVCIYYITDIVWGALEALHQTFLLYIDTEIYFVALALGVSLWTNYVIEYLSEKKRFHKFLYYAGRFFFGSVVLLVLINLFYPAIFWFDQEGLYHTGPIRYAILIAQIILLLLTSTYSLIVRAHSAGAMRKRHFIIGMSGMIMLLFISIQIFFPYLPLYTIAYMLGSCILRTFVVESEKEEYREELEAALEKEKRHLKELSIARKAAFTDALTGVKSKSACDDYTMKLQELIDNDEHFDFAISIFDCNNLKKINDNYGHDKGDEYLKATSALICKTFKHSPVFRIGGDEFVAFLTNDDYKDRKELIKQFEKSREETYEANRKDWEKVSVAIGMAEFDPSKDSTVNDTVNRADRSMYEDKRAWKETHLAR